MCFKLFAYYFLLTAYCLLLTAFSGTHFLEMGIITPGWGLLQYGSPRNGRNGGGDRDGINDDTGYYRKIGWSKKDRYKAACFHE
jgi:hypothetical protein